MRRAARPSDRQLLYKVVCCLSPSLTSEHQHQESRPEWKILYAKGLSSETVLYDCKVSFERHRRQIALRASSGCDLLAWLELINRVRTRGPGGPVRPGESIPKGPAPTEHARRGRRRRRSSSAATETATEAGSTTTAAAVGAAAAAAAVGGAGAGSATATTAGAGAATGTTAGKGSAAAARGRQEQEQEQEQEQGQEMEEQGADLPTLVFQEDDQDKEEGRDIGEGKEVKEERR
eukprot:763316-Hanusia_phi.AAC.2